MRRLPLVLCFLLVGSGCGQQAASQQAAQPAGIAPTQRDTSDIARRLGDAVYAINPTTRTQVAGVIVTGRRQHTGIAACLKLVGFPYPEYIEPLVDKSRLSENRAVPSWIYTPDRARADLGFGVHSAGRPVTLRAGDAADPSVGMSAEDLAKYDEASARCASQNEPQLDAQDEMVRLLGELELITGRTVDTPGFLDVRQRYTTCMAEQGWDIGIPEDALNQLTDETRGLGPEDELKMASSDFECRSPLYVDFVALRAADWDDWLTKNESAIASLVKSWRDLEAEAGI